MLDSFSPVRRPLLVAALVTSLGAATRVRAQGAPSVATPAADTTAAALRRLVLQHAPELAAQRAALAAATARARAAGHAGPAVLTAEAEGVPSGVDLTRAQSVRVQAEREFLSGARRAAARAVATTETDAAAASLALADQRASALVDRDLVALVGWGAVARRLVDEDSLLSSAEASLRARFGAGEARYGDVLRLRTERLRVQTDRADALTHVRLARASFESVVTEADGRRALDALLMMVAEPTGAAARATESALLSAPLTAAPDVDSLLAASGRVRLADAAVARATATRALLLAEQRPRLSGFAGVQRFAGEGGYPVGPVAGVSMSLPFTARAANQSAAGAAAADVLAAGADRRATLAAVRGALVAARERYEAARARLAVYDAALLRGAREERESALAAYRGGDLTLVELLDFERALARAELDRLRNRIDAADALADLLTAVSGGDAAPSSSSLRTSSTDDR